MNEVVLGGAARTMSVSAMARAVGVSRTRFYELLWAGVLPPPVYVLRTRRPVYLPEMAAEVRRMVREGVGRDGSPLAFNSTARRRAAGID